MHYHFRGYMVNALSGSTLPLDVRGKANDIQVYDGDHWMSKCIDDAAIHKLKEMSSFRLEKIISITVSHETIFASS